MLPCYYSTTVTVLTVVWYSMITVRPTTTIIADLQYHTVISCYVLQYDTHSFSQNSLKT